jgi:hypothetical protein
MKTRTDHSLSTVAVMIAALVFLGACRKDVANHSFTPGGLRQSPVRDSVQRPVVLITDSQALPPAVPPKAPLPQQSGSANSCPLLSIYGDTIVYPQPSNNSDYILHPVNNPGAGTYLSWPVGLAIDPASGAIDLTASETGMKYIIGFVPSGTQDTCLTTLTIGGASYADSVYVLDNNKKVATPYFDGGLNNANPCKNGNECKFDITGSAAAMGVVIQDNSGQLDLEKTLKGTSHITGLFGPAPVNGQTVIADLYYQIADDPSNNAVQHLAIQFVYYDSRSLVSASLLDLVSVKLGNLLQGSAISTSFNPKPPLVVIVRHN